MAQLSPTVGVVKPDGGMNTWKRLLLPSGKLSRSGRLVKALGHHTMQPITMPDMQYTMLVKKPTRRSTRILTPNIEALSQEFCSEVPREDLVIITESLEECVRRLLTWKEGMERTESKCREDKDHDLWYGPGPPAELGKFPCAVCRTGVGSNSIFCNGCKHWVHKKCSGLKRLKKDPDYRCTQCQGTARPLDGRPEGCPGQT